MNFLNKKRISLLVSDIVVFNTGVLLFYPKPPERQCMDRKKRRGALGYSILAFPNIFYSRLSFLSSFTKSTIALKVFSSRLSTAWFTSSRYFRSKIMRIWIARRDDNTVSFSIA